jgi:hypothetical protein
MAQTREQRDALLVLRRIADAVTAVVAETPHGAPSGHLYAVLMQHLTLDQFQSLMSVLVEAKRVRRLGNLYFPVEETR